MKTCKKCDTSYENIKDNFHKDKSREDGFHIYCKLCRKVQMKDNYIFKNPKTKSTCLRCGIDISELHAQKIRCDGCREIKERERKRKYYLKKRNCPEYVARRRVLNRIWRKNNPERYKEQMKSNNNKRKQSE